MRPPTPDLETPQLGLPAGRIHPLSRVWHVVLRSAAKPLRPERLATFVLPPDELARFGRAAVERAVMQARSQWAAIAVRAGYIGPEWRVDVVREVGFVRSVFPGAALESAPLPGVAPAPPPQLVTPPGGGTRDAT